MEPSGPEEVKLDWSHLVSGCTDADKILLRYGALDGEDEFYVEQFDATDLTGLTGVVPGKAYEFRAVSQVCGSGPGNCAPEEGDDDLVWEDFPVVKLEADDSVDAS